MRKTIVTLLLLISIIFARAQDSAHVPMADSLRIIDLNPYFSLHVDSVLDYQLQINKNPDNYYWYLKNAPIGLKINKSTGVVHFKAERSFFLSGKLKYDVGYKVLVGVQNLSDPKEKIDTNFTIDFYNTETVPSRVKPTVGSTIIIDEGDSVNFSVLCENGSFPIENIITQTNIPIGQFQPVRQCGDELSWTPSYELVKETDSAKVKIVNFYFIGSTKFQNRDTASIRVIVRNALNYPLEMEEYGQVVRNINRYVLQLKYTFFQLDKKLKRTRNYRTTFDLTSATTSLTGTIMSTSGSEDAQRTGKILPSVGLALVPIKEASVPNKNVDQNQAALIRTSIKRLEYMVQDNQVIGNKDPDIMRKIAKLKEELKATQVQLLEVPVELTNDLSEEELNRYFNSPKVNKKYRLSTN